MRLSEKQKKLLRRIGLPAVGVFTFVVAFELHVSVPAGKRKSHRDPWHQVPSQHC